MAVALHRFCREADLIAQVLTVAFVVLLAAYLVGSKPDSQEIIGLLPIGAVLAGRVLAGRLIRAGLVPAMALVLACYGGILVSHAVQPPAPSENQLAASWLQAHHLNYGLAGYWQANSITVDDGDRVQIRPVRVLDGQPPPDPRSADSDLPGRHVPRAGLAPEPAHVLAHIVVVRKCLALGYLTSTIRDPM